MADLTPRQLADKLAALGEAVPREFRKTSHGVGVAAVRFTREKMTEEIYSVPVDVTAAGKKKWRRTGALRRGEQAEVIDPYTVRITNTQSYAEPRHEAGKSGRRAINPLRESHWRDDLVETFRPILMEFWHQTVLHLLQRRPR